MAIIKCPECQSDVSNKSVYCLHCGFPIKKIARADLLKRKSKTLMQFLGKIPRRIKVFFTDSILGMILCISSICVAGSALVVLLGWLLMWLINETEFGLSIMAPIILIAANVGGYFFLYKKSKTWQKACLLALFVFEVFGIMTMIIELQ